MAGPLTGAYLLGPRCTGLGRLSRLRLLTGARPQLRSMNLRIETWSVYSCETRPPVDDHFAR
jgi:hypothetical protein